ncbi:hypothetical protein ACP5PY_26445 [Photobacterium leiognathi subsp. mandapamensis]
MTTTTEQEIAKLVSASTKLTEEVALQKDSTYRRSKHCYNKSK